ncbi:right-handed parallel beta-helix repeat-containing protein [Modestobacter sp. NPDC049651]|uniref:right-handed parallel beta-helix repeat-containing protein n=1 Tax=unclassified Modestobacter TaxID=2643866 RepID=UPI0033FE722F
MAAGLVLAAVPPGVAAAGGGSTTWVVHLGQSIQAAVDQARSGDTVKIAPGTYREAVCVVGKGLTVVGAGAGRTTITWPEWGAGKPLPPVAANPCWTAQEQADAEDDPGTLADDVSGFFFLNPSGPVSVSRLSTVNHPASGIVAWGAHGFDVHHTTGTGHERYGVSAAASTGISVTGNVEKGVDRGAPWYSGTAGVGVSDSDGARARIIGNRVEGENLGVFVRESRGGTVTGNTVTGNCVGILFFDDSATEVPDTSHHVEGGDFTISGNAAIANNRYCIAGRDGSQRVSGVGISVTNADHVRILGNVVRGHHPVVPAGAQPINYPPAGLNLVSFSPPPGTNPPGAVDPGLVEHVTVKGNVFKDNQPVDIWVTRPIPGTLLQGTGPGIDIRHNLCAASDPAGLCG